MVSYNRRSRGSIYFGKLYSQNHQYNLFRRAYDDWRDCGCPNRTRYRKKEERRKGKIQLIDATKMKTPLRKNMGNKNCEFSPEIRDEIVRIFCEMEESDVSKVFDNDEFGYWSVTVDRPLRLRIDLSKQIPDEVFKTATEGDSVRSALQAVAEGKLSDDWSVFTTEAKLKTALLKRIRPYITVRDESASLIPGEADTELRDTEIVPFKYPGGIEDFITNEVLTYAPDAYFDATKAQIGYEISFTKYFYKAKELRPMEKILADLRKLDAEADCLMSEIMEGLK